MKRSGIQIARVALIGLCLVVAFPPRGNAAENSDDALQGVWVGHSMEADGNALPAEAARQMRFTFKGDKLLVKGNFADGREEECSCKINSEPSPKHLDFTPPGEKKPVLGIYEAKGDELKLCLRHGGSSEGRPTEFATKAGSKLVLITFERQKP